MRRRVIAYLPGIVAAFVPFVVLWLVVQRGVDVPFYDEWEWVDLFYAAHHHELTLAAVWAPHNEHRMLVPNAIALLLDALGGWNVVREEAASLVILAMTQLCIWLLIRRAVPVLWRGIAFLASSVLLYSLIQYENYESGFQIQWFLATFGAVVTVWALARSKRSWTDVAIAALGATVAAFSLASGLFAFLAGFIVIGLIPRQRRVHATAWLVVAIAVTVLDRWGAGNGQLSGSRSIGMLVAYSLLYLGSPVAGSLGVGPATTAGVIVSAWLAGVATLAVRGPISLRVRLAPWLALGVYALTSAAATAIGRASSEPVWQALSSRYTTIAAFAWIGATVATFVTMARITSGWNARMSRLSAAMAAIPAALVLAFSLEQSQAGSYAWQQHVQQLQAGRDLLAADDVRALTLLYPWAGIRHVAALIDKLNQIRDGVFRSR